MHDSLRVKETDCHADLSCVESDSLLAESLMLLEHFIKLTSLDKRHNEVQSCR